MGRLLPLPLWIEIWLIASTIICAIDIAFTTLRPHTLRGGALERLFYLWNIYADVDVRYSSQNDLTTASTGRLMTIELVMNILSIFMNRKRSRHTLLMAFTSTVMVFWKTSIYLCLYVSPSPGNPDYIAPDTTFWQLIFVFWFPNSVWIVIPFLVMISLWNRLALPQPCDSRIGGNEEEKSSLYKE